MKIAIIGSRGLCVKNLKQYLPDALQEIVSGGARGIDSCAREYALKNKIKLTEFLPDYQKYGRYAPLKRNDEIIEYSDMVIAFWDGKSGGTRYVIKECRKKNVKIKVYMSK